jgi:Asp-tRNA(Asn)/Glu-tRNA(Gln) amidotransferase A subunit family amidase
MPDTPTLASLAADLDAGRTTARALVDECLAKIADDDGEGSRAFLHVDTEAAIEAAEAMDRLREVGAAPSPFAGIPISIKDLFDIKGQVTRAGSRALEDSAPAAADAPAVARLRRAGFVVIGRTNMTEFAYSGIGINPHYGTPKGALIERIAVPEFLDIAPMSVKGGLVAAESYAWHRYLIVAKGDIYDPRVAARILRGESQSAADYIDLLGARRSLVARAAARLAPYDALVLPTTANTPPRIADMKDDQAFTKANLLSLRNCTLINMIDGCGISLPIHQGGEVPVGLMLAASGGSDRRVFELAAAMEGVIRV